MPVTKRKVTGAHFTPPDLAMLVAERVAAPVSGLNVPLRVLDPACATAICSAPSTTPCRAKCGGE